MKPLRLLGAFALAPAVLLSTPAVFAAAANVPRPLPGHYKIEKGFSEGVVGSLVVSKGRTKVLHLMFKPEDVTYCATKVVRVHGPFLLHNVATSKGGDNDNTPDWSITTKDRAKRKVTAIQAGKTLHGTLSLTFGSKNGTTKPVNGAEGEFDSPGCSFVFGGRHG